MGQRKTRVQNESGLLTPGGYLRISADLLPKSWDSDKESDRNFVLIIDQAAKTIELQPSNGKHSDLPKRRAVFSNSSAKSPYVSLRGPLEMLGIPLPEESMQYKIEKMSDGRLVIQF